jgi:4,5-DOPA dioxygenase extradiol
MSAPPTPALFLSHGAPTLPLDRDHPTHAFLKRLGTALPRPEAILMVSAHWDTAVPTLSTAAVNGTFHDFYGFPEELYALRYPAPGAPELARDITKLLRAADFDVQSDAERGLDHGAWVPLLLMYPQADIPVLQLSLQTGAGTRHHLMLGAALKPLRARGVLVVGSGGATHNLREFFRPTPGLDASYVPEFTQWLADTLARRDLDALAEYRQRAPQATRAHPSEEHFLPLLVAAAAGDAPGERIHTALTGASLAMDAYRFD